MAISKRICSIQNCCKPHEARGWCKTHWSRWNRHGDPLGSNTPKREPGRFLREEVLPFKGNDCLIWPYGKSGDGYGCLTLDGKKVSAHRAVCEEVNGAPPTPKHEAAHSCGNGHLACVTPNHLSWKTRKENSDDRVVHGTHNRGTRHASARFTEDEVRAILSQKGKKTQKEIADTYGVSPAAICSIHARRSWAWLE